MQSAITQISSSGKSRDIYLKLLEQNTYTKPSEFIKKIYKQYKNNYESNSSINGKIFEYLVCECLAQEGILPLYYQAQFERVPNAEFDILLYNSKTPVVLTIKTSLRERYKQADKEHSFL